MRAIDGKYHIEDERIIRTATGEVVPEEEPLFLFRARDPLAQAVLRHYIRLCADRGCTARQLVIVAEKITEFGQFVIKRPEAMKMPGSTLTRGDSVHL